jgi:hypothetical protein
MKHRFSRPGIVRVCSYLRALHLDIRKLYNSTTYDTKLTRWNNVLLPSTAEFDPLHFGSLIHPSIGFGVTSSMISTHS